MALIGAGRVATAFGVLLERAGWRIAAAWGRGASRERVERHLPGTRFVAEAEEAVTAAEVAILGVPDDRLAEACAVISPGLGAGRFVAHLSGSASLDVLADAARAGADVLSVHPLQSFPDVATGVARLPGSAMAVTAGSEAGDRQGHRLASAVGARPFRLADGAKPLYHAAAVFCSNYLVTVQAVAERLLRRAGVPDPLEAMAPLARASLEAAMSGGPTWALTGPAVRGDRGTVARNLAALRDAAPETVPVYLALARATARLAEEGGRLEPGVAGLLAEELDRWT